MRSFKWSCHQTADMLAAGMMVEQSLIFCIWKSVFFAYDVLQSSTSFLKRNGMKLHEQFNEVWKFDCIFC